MSAQIQRDFEFQAGVYFQSEFLINHYEFNVVMDVTTESIYEQNIAMERLKYLVYECFENSIFIAFNETDIIQKYTNAGLKVCLLPEEPYDQIIALLLILKSNAVCENRLRITDISLTSKLSDGVKFIENIETASHAIPKEGWWDNNYPTLCSQHQSKKSKVVKLIKDEWSELNLGWKQKKSKAPEVVFTTSKDKNP